MHCSIKQLARRLDLLLNSDATADVQDEIKNLVDSSNIVLDHPETVIQFEDGFSTWYPRQKRLLETYCQATINEREQTLAKTIAARSIGDNAKCIQKVQNIPTAVDISSRQYKVSAKGKRDFFLYANDQQSAMVIVNFDSGIYRLNVQVISSAASEEPPWDRKIQLTGELLKIQNQMYNLVLGRMIKHQDCVVYFPHETGNIVNTLCSLFAMHTCMQVWKHILFNDIVKTKSLIIDCMRLFYSKVGNPTDVLSRAENDGLHDRILNTYELTDVTTEFYKYKSTSICILTANSHQNIGTYRISVQNTQIPEPTNAVAELSEAIFEVNVFAYPDQLYLPRTTYKTKMAFMNDLMHRSNTDGMILQCHRQKLFFTQYFSKSKEDKVRFAQSIAKIRFENKNIVSTLRSREIAQSVIITAPEHASCNITEPPAIDKYYEPMYDTFVFKSSNSKRFIVQVELEFNTCKVSMVAFNPFGIPRSGLLDMILYEMVQKGHPCTEFRKGIEEIVNLLRGESTPVNFIKQYEFDGNHENPPYHKRYLSDEFLNKCIASSYIEITQIKNRILAAEDAETVPLEPQYDIHEKEQSITSQEYDDLLQLHDDANTLDTEVKELEKDMATQVEALRARSPPSIYKVTTPDGKHFCLFQAIIEWNEFDPMARRSASGIMRRFSIVPIEDET